MRTHTAGFVSRALIARGAVVLSLAGSVAAAQSSAPATGPAIDQHGPTIKDAYAKSFLIGMAGDLPGNYSQAELALVKENFNVVTPENCMKPAPVHPAEDTWHFERP